MTILNATPLLEPTGECGAPRLDALKRVVAAYERPDDRRAWFEFATSLPPFVLCCWLMYRTLELPYWVTLVLAIPTAGFVVRTFIVQHDCGHGSFFGSRRARDWVGRLCSLVTLVPFGYFRYFHGTHHATSGKLDRRGVDLETITVREYLERTPLGRLHYRIARNPIVLFLVAPLLYFIVALRVPALAPRSRMRDRWSILLTDVALFVVAGFVIHAVGVVPLLKVQLPVTAIASTTGMWMFYVQHQFEDTYWARDGEWDYARAALEGSSYYALPAVLEWFTGYIGLHHVHHLSTLVPSYRLTPCHRENDVFAGVPRLGFVDGLRCMRLKLWDEENGRLVGWSHLR
ncbi:MAG: fatty acid desaturase [bacterium]